MGLLKYYRVQIHVQTAYMALSVACFVAFEVLFFQSAKLIMIISEYLSLLHQTFQTFKNNDIKCLPLYSAIFFLKICKIFTMIINDHQYDVSHLR